MRAEPMRVRFTVRRAMLAVALVAVAVAGGQRFVTLREKSRQYQNRAKVHDVLSQYRAVRSRSARSGVGEKEAAKKSAEWHAGRRDFYKEAAARPWRDVPPASEPKSD